MVVRVVHPGQVEALPAPFQTHRFVQQQPDAQVLHARHHADGVVVAEHGIDGIGQEGPQLRQGLQGGIVGAVGAGAEIARHDAEVIVQIADGAHDGAREVLRHVEVQIGQVQDAETLESPRQPRQGDTVAVHPDAPGVAPPAAIEAGKPHQAAHQAVDGIPVLDVEEVAAQAEDACFVVLLDAEALPQMGPSHPGLQAFQQRAVRRRAAPVHPQESSRRRATRFCAG